MMKLFWTMMAHSNLRTRSQLDGLQSTRNVTHGGITMRFQPASHAAQVNSQDPPMMSQQDNEMLDDEGQAQQQVATLNAAGKCKAQIGHPRTIRVTISVEQRLHRVHHGLFALENMDTAGCMVNNSSSESKTTLNQM